MTSSAASSSVFSEPTEETRPLAGPRNAERHHGGAPAGAFRPNSFSTLFESPPDPLEAHDYEPRRSSTKYSQDDDDELNRLINAVHETGSGPEPA
jgi:hypothetical protein